MAHFYGRLQGNRGEATRLGSRASGIFSTVETWGAIIRTSIDHDEGADREGLTIRFSTKHGNAVTYLALTDIDTAMRLASEGDLRVRAALAAMQAAADEINDVCALERAAA